MNRWSAKGSVLTPDVLFKEVKDQNMLPVYLWLVMNHLSQLITSLLSSSVSIYVFLQLHWFPPKRVAHTHSHTHNLSLYYIMLYKWRPCLFICGVTAPAEEEIITLSSEGLRQSLCWALILCSHSVRNYHIFYIFLSLSLFLWHSLNRFSCDPPPAPWGRVTCPFPLPSFLPSFFRTHLSVVVRRPAEPVGE